MFQLPSPQIPRRPVALVCAFLVTVSLSVWNGCGSIGSEVENEQFAKGVKDGKGHPVDNALVRVFTVDHIPGSSLAKAARKSSLVWETRTDAEGRFRLDSISAGQYNVLISKDSLRAFRDSVFLAPGVTALPADTLKAPATLSGFVRVQPVHDPRSATVQVLGTDIYTNVDAAGRFVLSGMAGGDYRLRIVSTITEYAPLFFATRVVAGKANVLQDTLALPFTGVPTVTGLRASYDSTRGIVTLNWNAVQSTQIAGYAVFRDPAGAVNLSTQPYNTRRITGTTFFDTLSFSQWRDSAGTDTILDSETQNWEYRVVVIPKSGGFGQPFEMIDVRAVSTYASFGILSLIDMSPRPHRRGDTVRIEARWQGVTVTPKTLEYALYNTRGFTITRSNRQVNTVAGRDTLRIQLKDSSIILEAKLFDASGRSIRTSLYIPNFDSVVSWVDTAGPVDTLPPIDTLPTVDTAFQARILVQFPSDSAFHLPQFPTEVARNSTLTAKGVVVGWNDSALIKEWNVNNTGFKQVAGDSLSIVAPNSATNPLYIFRVRRGNMFSLDTLWVQVR